MSGFAETQTAAPAPPGLRPGAGCWRTVGTYGDRSCPELASWAHCRHCPVQEEATREVLNRPLPEGYLRHWTEKYARETPPGRSPSTSAVPFRIASEWLALPTRCFQEVTERRPIHSLPRSGTVVLGLANMRGELLICVSLGHLLGLANIPPRARIRSHYERLVVLYWAGHRIAFPVDEVQGPYRFYAEDMKPLPGALAKANPAYAESVLQWRTRTAVLLDADLLFSALNRNLT